MLKSPSSYLIWRETKIVLSRSWHTRSKHSAPRILRLFLRWNWWGRLVENSKTPSSRIRIFLKQHQLILSTQISLRPHETTESAHRNHLFLKLLYRVVFFNAIPCTQTNYATEKRRERIRKRWKPCKRETSARRVCSCRGGHALLARSSLAFAG